ncbi:hypothetical protein LTR95_012804 [Oleoguttula sp. CCFEE 5521]
MVNAPPAALPMVGNTLLKGIKGFAMGFVWFIIAAVCFIASLMGLAAFTVGMAYYYTTLLIAIRWLAGSRTVFMMPDFSLWENGAVCAGISTILSFILGAVVTDRSTNRNTTFLHAVLIAFKSYPTSALAVAALISALLGVIGVLMVSCSAISAIRARCAISNGDRGDSVEVIGFIDKEEDTDNLDAVAGQSNHAAIEEIERQYPSTFAGFRAYFVAEMRQPNRKFFESTTESEDAACVAPSMDGRTA